MRACGRRFVPAGARAAVAALCLVALAPSARSQAPDERLQRLDPATRAAVVDLVDSAHAGGLPTEPLIQKALQGAMKHADGARIVAAVRGLEADLTTARGALGAASTPAELVAGAGAVRAGISPADLATLRSVRPREPLTVPLATLADLVSQGVPANVAADAVLTLARRHASDDQFEELWRDVGRDIEAGTAPADAASARAHGSSGSEAGSGGAGASGHGGNAAAGNSGTRGNSGKPSGPPGLGGTAGPGGHGGASGAGAAGAQGGHGPPASVPRQPGAKGGNKGKGGKPGGSSKP